MIGGPRYPFSAVVGSDEVKLALLLAGIEPAIGGVLLRGEKGSAKTTLARGLAALLPGSAPFVELPVGATEDRMIGSLDLAEALAGGEMRLRPGLLAAADGGVLYVDEVNLLADHLVDALLDVAASGVNRVEREGVAHAHRARFVLVGSMNPEEGELRPQLLDRFGLCVEVAASPDPSERAVAVRRRLSFEAAQEAFVEAWAQEESQLSTRLAAAVTRGPALLESSLIQAVSALCVSVGVEGLRADLVICRGAAALASWEDREAASIEDVRRIAPMALAHRARRSPLDSHGVDDDRLAEELDRHLGTSSSASNAGDEERSQPEEPSDEQPHREDHPSGPDTGHDDGGGRRGQEERVFVPGPVAPVVLLDVSRSAGSTEGPSGRRSLREGPRGRLIGDRAPGPTGPTSVALGATVGAALTRRVSEGGPTIVASDVREAVREQRGGNLIVLAVDASGSMGATARMEAVKGAVLGLLVDAYQRRDRVALVTFRGDDAQIVLRPTGSVEVARARLVALPTGGRTPLGAGLDSALEAAGQGGGTHAPLIIVVTDGRATAGPPGRDPLDAARRSAEAIRLRRIPAVVVDVETGQSRLGLAAELAAVMGAQLLTLDELTSSSLVSAVRRVQQPGRHG